MAASNLNFTAEIHAIYITIVKYIWVSIVCYFTVVIVFLRINLCGYVAGINFSSLPKKRLVPNGPT